jgi:hypothetical protein
LLLPRAEVHARFCAAVDADAARWWSDRGHRVLREFGQYGAPAGRPSDVLREVGPGPVGLGVPLTGGAASAFLGPMLKDAMAAWLRGQDYHDGLPAAERPAVIARLQAELEAAKAAEEALVDEMNGAGLAVEHRPDVRERRDRAERDRTSRDREAEARAERETRLNERHAAANRRRVVRPNVLSKTTGEQLKRD